jgi:hypothetical protein
MNPVEALFGVSWDGLERDHVTSFLAGAGDEGLTWEVKGDAKEGRWLRREQIEKAVSGFANSELGGILIIGAQEDEGGWDLTGLQPPSESEVALVSMFARRSK